MKKILMIIVTGLILINCVYASSNTFEINSIEFKIPEQYQGGEFENDKYELDDIFSIRCIDDNIARNIGLWAVEKDFSEDLNIHNHPIRHFSQYNNYNHNNQSHAYFSSGNSIYEITWKGEEINTDIENIIKNTPASEINDESFYNTLDESIDIYKKDKIDKLNKDGEYNYLEAKYQSQSSLENQHDDTRFKEILYSYYF